MGYEERTGRTARLIGREGVEKLRRSHVMLFGLGGVGSYAAEALARAGVGEMTIVDADEVALSNINRQLPALIGTVGRKKTDVVAERLTEINPELALHAVCAFHLPTSPVAIPENVTYVLDAIDTVAAKVDLAVTCQARGIPLLSCMGMGNRLDPTRIRIGDLFATSYDPLCRAMRRELRKRGVDKLECVYSEEAAIAPRENTPCEQKGGRPAPASIAFVPSVAGLYMSYRCVRDLLEKQ